MKDILKKGLAIGILGLFMIDSGFGQSLPVRPSRCATGGVMEKYFQKYPREKILFDKNQQNFQLQYEAVRRAKKEMPPQKRTQAIITIPVVVHIVMDNPSLVSDDQVQSQIDVLNADYAGENADSVNIPEAFKPFFGKSNIRFCLAQRNPAGEPTTGITRKVSATTSIPGDNDPIKYAAMGGADGWDINKYLNIWVCKMTDNSDLGYSFMPGLPGLSPSDVGLVNAYHAFGTIGSAQSPFNKGRTATHEIGHFLNLWHIWGANECVESCADSDLVDDTPNQGKCNYGTPTFPLTDGCTSTAPGLMFMNFMDYVDDATMCMFTAGQADRMETALSTLSDRKQLVTSNGCVPPILFDRDVKAIGVNVPANSLVYCSGNQITPQLRIRNVGSMTLTTLVLNVKLDSNNPVTTNINLNLAPLGETTISGSAMAVSPGQHSMTLYTTLPNGDTDQQSANDTATAVFSVIGDATDPLIQDFETAAFPGTGWGIGNSSDVMEFNPVRVTNAAHSGSASVKFDNFNFQLFGKYGMLVSPQLSVPLNADSVKITFWRAAAQYSRSHSDTLEVLISTDCGQTYSSVYKKGGADLKTRSDYYTSEFIPSADEWVADTADISNLVKGRYDKIVVQFRNINGYGNNIFLDDIQVYSRVLPPALKEKGLLISPNPTTGIIHIRHYPSTADLRGIAIYSSTGQLVWKQDYRSGIAPDDIPVNLQRMASGVYIVHLVYTNNSISQKILKMN